MPVANFNNPYCVTLYLPLTALFSWANRLFTYIWRRSGLGYLVLLIKLHFDFIMHICNSLVNFLTRHNVIVPYLMRTAHGKHC
jgi:hypothetical protein